MLVLAALSNPADTWASMLFVHFSIFSTAYYSSLKLYIHAGVSPPDAAAADISHAYAAIKLWLLLTQKKAIQLNGTPKLQSVSSAREDSGNIAAFMIWNELWPHFESLVNVFEVEAQFGTVSVSVTPSPNFCLIESALAPCSTYMDVSGRLVPLYAANPFFSCAGPFVTGRNIK
jgi:hypothetical protein